METVAPLKEIIDVIKESGGDAFKFCYQCGLCDTVCPWNRVRDFSMRKIVRQASFGMTEIENEEIWRCSTCGNCPQKCPRGVEQIEVGVAIRRIAAAYDVEYIPGLMVILAFYALGQGLIQPSLTSLTSKLVEPDEVGGVMGLYQAFSSLARIIGPVWAEIAFHTGSAWPFRSAAVAYALALALAVVLTRRLRA